MRRVRVPSCRGRVTAFALPAYGSSKAGESPELANVPAEPPRGDRRHGLLHGADGDLPPTVRVVRHEAQPSRDPAPATRARGKTESPNASWVRYGANFSTTSSSSMTATFSACSQSTYPTTTRTERTSGSAKTHRSGVRSSGSPSRPPTSSASLESVAFIAAMPGAERRRLSHAYRLHLAVEAPSADCPSVPSKSPTPRIRPPGNQTDVTSRAPGVLP